MEANLAEFNLHNLEYLGLIAKSCSRTFSPM